MNYETGQILYENPLSGPGDIRNWVFESRQEGHPAVTFPHGTMRMESDVPFLLWPPESLPDNIMISWDFRPRSEFGLAMCWFATEGRGGENIFDPGLAMRDGDFRQYHSGDLNALHVSYYRRNQRRADDEITFRTCNLRKSHGHHMVAQGGDPLPGARDAVRFYRISVIKSGPRVRMMIDDLIIMDWYDDGTDLNGNCTGPALGSGYVGFRQMPGLIADYRNLAIQEVHRA